MAVKSAKKAIEAAGLPTGTLEEGQEAVQEGQEAPKRKRRGKIPRSRKSPRKSPRRGGKRWCMWGRPCPGEC